jgi:hypothetical protein
VLDLEHAVSERRADTARLAREPVRPCRIVREECDRAVMGSELAHGDPPDLPLGHGRGLGHRISFGPIEVEHAV